MRPVWNSQESCKHQRKENAQHYVKIPPLDTVWFPKTNKKYNKMLIVNFIPAFPPSVNLWQAQMNPVLGKPHHPGGRMGSLLLDKVGTIFSTKRARAILSEAGCFSSIESNKNCFISNSQIGYQICPSPPPCYLIETIL